MRIKGIGRLRVQVGRRLASLIKPAVPLAFALALVIGLMSPTVASAARPTHASLVVRSQRASNQPRHRVLRTRILGHLIPRSRLHPQRCVLDDTQTLPTPSSESLTYVSEAAQNQVETVNESTGSLIGSPISTGSGSGPSGIAYWKPPTSSHADPLVVVAGTNNNTVTIIDAATSSVVSTITLPSSQTDPARVAVSPTSPFALVMDFGSSTVSIINLQTDTDIGYISLTSTDDVLNDVAFASGGDWAYVSSPTQEKIYVLEYVGGSTPYALEQSFSTGNVHPNSLSTDVSLSGGTALVVANDGSSTGQIVAWSDSSGTLSGGGSDWTSLSSSLPGIVRLTPGSQDVWAQIKSSKEVAEYVRSPSSYTYYNVPTSFTDVGPIGVSAGDSPLLVPDTGSSTVAELSTTESSGGSLNVLNSTSTSGTVSGIAPAISSPNGWDAVVIDKGGDVDIVNTGSGTITQTLSDANTPEAVAVSPDGKYAYVANTDSVSVIEMSLIGSPSNPIVDTITSIQGSEPNTPTLDAIAVSPTGDSVIVTDTSNGAAYVIDTNPADGSSYRTVVKRIGLTGGTDSTTVMPGGSIVFSPDGLFAYVSEQGVSSDSYDGIAVLSLASTTTTGYNYLATDEALTQHGVTMIEPTVISINPDDEYLYVQGDDSADDDGAIWTFPVETSGQIGDGSSTTGPIWPVNDIDDLALSPEAQMAYVTNGANLGMSAISLNKSYSSTAFFENSTSGFPYQLAVSPDGEYVAVTNAYFCDEGEDAVDLYNADSGVLLNAIEFPSEPTDIAFVPQSSPTSISTTELAGDATNPGELGVASDINDVNGSGTPSDATGVTAGTDTATGRYSLSLQSMDVPDVGFNLLQTASYDSSRAATAGLLGHGWDYTYGLTASQNGSTCVITITESDGATVSLNPTTASGACGSRSYAAPTWAQVRLAKVVSDCNGSDSCWQFVLAATTTYEVDETTGQLISESNPNGNTLTVSWGSHSACAGATSADPCVVTAPDGIRTLTYSYPSPGTGVCPSSASSCVEVTDPLGRTVVYVMNSAGQLSDVTLSYGSESATYAFEYNTSNLLTSWWTPQNNATYSGNTAYATDITYTSGKVTEVTSPTMLDAGTSLGSTYVPTSTFTYTDFDNTSGTGAVLTSDANYDQSSSMGGANQTLDTYADFELVSSVQGYGPLGAYGSNPVAPTVSESATPMRDPFTLMPDEVMDADAGQLVGPVGSSGFPTLDLGLTVNAYDGSANLLSTTDQDGNTTTFSYNALNEVVTESQPGGTTTTEAYDSDGNLLSVVTPATNAGGSTSTETYAYVASGTDTGLVCASLSPDGYADGVRLSGCPSGATTYITEYGYDSSGDLTSEINGVGDVTTADFDADGNQCATLSPDGWAAGSTYHLNGTCPSAGIAYGSVFLGDDVYGNPLQEVSPTNAPGGTEDNFYNLNGDQVATTSPMGLPLNCVSGTPANGPSSNCVDTTYRVYDADGNVMSSYSPGSTAGSSQLVTTFGNDPDGNQVATVSPNGNVSGCDCSSEYESISTFDNLGNTVTTTDASGVTSQAAYDGNGNESSQTNGTGSAAVSESLSYTPGGLLAATTLDPGGSASTYEDVYNADDQTCGTITPDGVAAGQTLTSCPSSSATYETANTFAPGGEQAASEGPMPNSSTSGGTASILYDASGNPEDTVSPQGSAGSCNPLTSSSCPSTIYRKYDAANELTSSTTLGESGSSTTTYYFYDPSGNVIAEMGPDGSYGSCNPETSDSCAGTSYFTYDADGRLSGESYTDGSADVTFVYNNDGERTSMTDATGTTNYYYDGSGNLTEVENGSGAVETYSWSPDGLATCVSYPNASGNTCTSRGSGSGIVTYTYEPDDNIASVTDWLGDTVSFRYNSAGQMCWMTNDSSLTTSCSSIPVANGSVTTSFGYDPGTGYMESSDTTTGTGATNLLDMAISSWDANGNATSVTTTVAGGTGNTDDYSFNDADQILSGPTVGSSGAYAFTGNVGGTAPPAIDTGAVSDNGGSYETAVDNPEGAVCWTDPSALTMPLASCGSPPSGSTQFGYDEYGALTSETPPSGDPESMAWQGESSELVCLNSDGTSCSTSSPTSSTETFTYDGLGRVATVSVGGALVDQPVWDGAIPNRVLADSNYDFIYGPGSSPLLQISKSTSSVDEILYDQRNNARAIVQLSSGSGQDSVVNYTDYDASGNAITGSGGSADPQGMSVAQDGYTVTTPIGFDGTYTIGGLDFSGSRFYSPGLGQFISVDPDVLDSGSPYSYASDNPVSFGDPTGDWTVGFCGSINFAGIISLGDSVCLQRTQWTPNDDIGISDTHAYGVGCCSIGFGAGVQISNANTLVGICCRFLWADLSVKIGLSVTFDAFSNTPTGNQKFIYGATVELGVGAGIGVSGGFSWTMVCKENWGWIADPLRWVVYDPIWGGGNLFTAAYNAVGGAGGTLKKVKEHKSSFVPGKKNSRAWDSDCAPLLGVSQYGPGGPWTG